MILAVDIGNSNVVIGVRKGELWLHMWRIPTSQDQEASYFYDVGIRNKLLEHSIDPKDVEGIIMSTVVPSLKEVFRSVLMRIFDMESIIVGPEVYKLIGFDVPRPYEIGTDLVSNAYAAFRAYGRDCVVVDFGTALTFTTVSQKGYVMGVSITPGIKTSMKALSSSTAQLPEIPLELPESVLGQNTTHAIQAGILWGYVGITKEMLAKIRAEVGEHFISVATGGLSFVMKPLESVFYEIDPMLTLNGLIYMYKKLQE